eukprot:6205774-Pleurochrysis_carterae.AAC.5
MSPPELSQPSESYLARARHLAAEKRHPRPTAAPSARSVSERSPEGGMERPVLHRSHVPVYRSIGQHLAASGHSVGGGISGSIAAVCSGGSAAVKSLESRIDAVVEARVDWVARQPRQACRLHLSEPEFKRRF